MNAPRVLSLFAGIGGFDLGLERAGFLPAGQIEIDPFCQRVLAARWPGVKRATDVRGIGAGLVERAESGTQGRGGESAITSEHVDLLVGGFPCQDLSVAGKRAGLGGERSGLFWEIVRIAKITRPTWGLFENVPGLISSHRGRDLWLVLQGLRECWPVVGYRVFDSRYFGVPQRRRRIFFVCGPTEAGVASVLALGEGGDGDLAAGREAGPDVASTIIGGVAGSRSHGKPSGSDRRPLVVAHAISAGEGNRFGSGRDGQDDFVVSRDTAHALKAKGNMDHREDGDTLVGGIDVGAIAQPAAVRRLTPLECERLQGFPDGWSCLCQPLDAYAAAPDEAALRCICPDSPRYRALGNAVTVSVVSWIGRRLMEAMRG